MYNKIRGMVLAGLFVALEIILTRFLSVENSIIRISFEFIPIAISAIVLGPVTAGIAAAIADIMGMMIFPKGAYFPGFTFSAFVSGFLYGLILYKKKVTILRCFFSALAVTVVASLVMNTIWLVIITKNGVFAILGPRIVKDLIFLPLKTFLVYFVWKAVELTTRRTLSSKA
jgi:ECF transporter S component (folate family)